MTMLLLSLVAIGGIFPKSKDLDLERIRSNFGLAATDKTVCRMMLVELCRARSTSVSLAYLGGFQAIWANHVFNPLAKMETFNKGKANIEQAVVEDPTNVEIRFVRLSVQTHCPWFVPYHQHEQEDRLFLSVHRASPAAESLKQLIDAILK